jgi:hypothetical protein
MAGQLFREKIEERIVRSEANVLSERSESKGFTHMAFAQANSFFVYILRCSDDRLYVGHATDWQNVEYPDRRGDSIFLVPFTSCNG